MKRRDEEFDTIQPDTDYEEISGDVDYLTARQLYVLRKLSGRSYCKSCLVPKPQKRNITLISLMTSLDPEISSKELLSFFFAYPYRNRRLMGGRAPAVPKELYSLTISIIKFLSLIQQREGVSNIPSWITDILDKVPAIKKIKGIPVDVPIDLPEDELFILIQRQFTVDVNEEKVCRWLRSYITSLDEGRGSRSKREHAYSIKRGKEFLTYFIDEERKKLPEGRQEITVNVNKLNAYNTRLYVTYRTANLPSVDRCDEVTTIPVVESMLSMENDGAVQISSMQLGTILITGPFEFTSDGSTTTIRGEGEISITPREVKKSGKNSPASAVSKAKRRIKHNNETCLFEVYEHKKKLNEFPLSGFNESILKIITEAKKPLTRKEITERHNRTEEIEGFASYIKRINETIEEVNMKIVCKGLRYSLTGKAYPPIDKPASS